MGETYGFNFRHYGAEYKTCKENYEGQGFDQVNYVLDLIKNNPQVVELSLIYGIVLLDKASLPLVYVNINLM